MISEKTVELNLTTELVNKIYKATGNRPYILAPSQRQEGTLGYDVALGQTQGQGVLIQYKRAYVNTPNKYEFHLNRTATRDQHQRLQVLESLGIPVFYAFPIFHLPAEVIQYRRYLLVHTKFVRPSRIRPVGGPTGHHDVIYDSDVNKWTVHSSQGSPIEVIETYEDVYKELFSEVNANNLKKIFESFNAVFSNKEPIILSNIKIAGVNEEDASLTLSQSVLTF